MKLSTRGRYGIKAMVSLAEQYGRGPISVASISALQNISLPYLEQLMAALKKASLVEAVRGVQGGYTLVRDPSEITIEEVLDALEGTTAVIGCVGYDFVGCENACSCAARPLWLKLQNSIDTILKETTIKDLADDYIIQKERMKDHARLS